MDIKYEILDEDEYELIDSYQDCYTYVRKTKININQKENGNVFAFKNNLCSVPIDYGEVICSHIARKTIKNGCEAVLTKRKIIPSHPQNYEYGVSSYYCKKENDELIIPIWFIRDYFQKLNVPIEKRIADIDICINAIFDKVYIELKRPYYEFLNIKQQYIDMIMLDCKLGNYDRNTRNWMLIQDGDYRLC